MLTTIWRFILLYINIAMASHFGYAVNQIAKHSLYHLLFNLVKCYNVYEVIELDIVYLAGGCLWGQKPF